MFCGEPARRKRRQAQRYSESCTLGLLLASSIWIRRGWGRGEGFNILALPFYPGFILVVLLQGLSIYIGILLEWKKGRNKF